MEEQLRGQLTDRIKQKSVELLGYEIDRTELRLMVHLQYIMTNEQRIVTRNVNNEELEVLKKWVELG